MATPQPAEGTLKRAAEHPANVGAHDALAKRPKADVPTDEVTEAEAALYDRQIRLWGLAAQNRMRKSHILVHNLQGIATEVIKNIVLSGIGTLTIVDPHEVGATDLSSGFFFREEDVGQPRVDAARERIQKLNPLVTIESITDASILTNAERLAQLEPDVIVSTAGSKDDLLKLNALTRKLGIRFYTAQTQGLNGWFFSDLGAEHTYLVEIPASEGKRTKVQYQQGFVPLETALTTTWVSLKPRQVQRLKFKPGLFATLAYWSKPTANAEELKQSTYALMKERGVPPDSLATDSEWTTFLSSFLKSLPPTSGAAGLGDFSPTSAVLGGLVGQDLLNALGGSQPPMANFVYLEGLVGDALVYKLGVGEPRKVDLPQA